MNREKPPELTADERSDVEHWRDNDSLFTYNAECDAVKLLDLCDWQRARIEELEQQLMALDAESWCFRAK
jgi:hypothetical protein